MAHSSPLGVSAQIIQFTNSAPAPVQQLRGPGRNPKMVVRLAVYRSNRKPIQCASSEYAHGMALGRTLYAQQQQSDPLGEAKAFLQTAERIFNSAQFEVARLTEKTKRGGK